MAMYLATLKSYSCTPPPSPDPTAHRDTETAPTGTSTHSAPRKTMETRKMRAFPRHRVTPPTVHNNDNNPPTPSLSTLPPELILLIDDHLFGAPPSSSSSSSSSSRISHPTIPTADNLSFRTTTRRIAAACAAYPSSRSLPLLLPPRAARAAGHRFRRRCHRDAMERERSGASPWWARVCAECCGAHGFWMFDAVELAWAARGERRCFGWAEVWEGALWKEEDRCFREREAARRGMGGRTGERVEGEEGPGWTKKFLKAWMSVVVVVERLVWVVIKAAWMIAYILLHLLEWAGEMVDLLGRGYRSVGK